MTRLLLAWLFVAVSSGHAPVELRVNPTVCLTPCSVLLRVRVEPDAGNRVLVVEIADSASAVYHSERALDGEYAPITQPERIVERIEPGDYEVIAATVGADGTLRHQARAHLLVN